MNDDELKRRFYPETNLSGFSHVDGTIAFYQQVVAIIRPGDTVLDFGAGRGELLADDSVGYRREVCDLRTRCGHLDGCDIDPVVLENPFLNRAKVVHIGAPLPYEDNRFDVIVARYVFEHIENPSHIAREFFRVLKPGGVIAATTPSKWGYIGIAARIIPSRHHVAVLSQSQPERKPEDVFPTHYKMNTRRALGETFGDSAEVFIVRRAPEPVYHFGRQWLFKTMKWLNKHTPDSILPVMDIFIRKAR